MEEIEIPYEAKSIPAIVTHGEKSFVSDIGVVLTHGAGGDMHLPQLTTLASVLSTYGFTVLRFTCKGLNIKYRCKVYGCIVDYFCSHCKLKGVFIGGRSMGSRCAVIISNFQDCNSESLKRILGVICLAYPLHPERKPSQLRDTPLIEHKQPLLLIMGTEDRMCQKTLLEKTTEKLSCLWSIHWMNGCGHGFDINGKFQEKLYYEACHVISNWCLKICSE